MAIRFDQLITAIASGVIEAQHHVRQAQIGELSQYFRDGAPISVELEIPRVNPTTGRHEQVKVRVPLMTLVNTSSLSIQEMQINLPVDMSEISEAVLAEAQPKEAREKAAVPGYQWKPPEYRPLIAASTITGKQPGQVGIAQVTLTVTAEETPEGLAKLLTHLNKSL